MNDFKFSHCDDAEDFGKLLTEIRLSLNISQEGLAKQIGVSKNVVSRWENQEYSSTLTFTLILKIAEVLGLGGQPFDRQQPNVVRLIRAGSCSLLRKELKKGGFLESDES